MPPLPAASPTMPGKAFLHSAAGQQDACRRTAYIIEDAIVQIATLPVPPRLVGVALYDAIPYAATCDGLRLVD